MPHDEMNALDSRWPIHRARGDAESINAALRRAAGREADEAETGEDPKPKPPPGFSGGFEGGARGGPPPAIPSMNDALREAARARLGTRDSDDLFRPRD